MDQDTDIGGHDDRFPPTQHSVVASARSGDEALRRRAQEVVVAAYWKPVYKYVRIKWRLDNESAKDLTQGFFVNAIDSGFFSRFDPARAKFRTYLRLCLDGFVANERKAAGRIKRGGGVAHIPLDYAAADGEIRHMEPADPVDPETLFHDEWVRHLFSECVEELRQHCEANDKTVCFEVFERYDLDSADNASYADLAENLGLPVTQVTNHLAWARRTFRALVLDRLRAASGSEQEYLDDVRELLGGDTP